MNYRRGLQRIYAVLASVWIVAVFVAIFSGEFEPWKPFETPASQTVDFAPSELSTTPPTEAQRDGSPAPLDFSGAKFADQPTSANAFNLKQQRRERLREWVWAFGLALAPVGVAYLLLFTVTGWIYRGFKS
jgi:hypothetical protein